MGSDAAQKVVAKHRKVSTHTGNDPEQHLQRPILDTSQLLHLFTRQILEARVPPYDGVERNVRYRHRPAAHASRVYRPRVAAPTRSRPRPVESKARAGRPLDRRRPLESQVARDLALKLWEEVLDERPGDLVRHREPSKARVLRVLDRPTACRRAHRRGARKARATRPARHL